MYCIVRKMTEECIICCGKIEEANSLACQHKNNFHEDCLNQWGKGRCPICRATQKLAIRINTEMNGSIWNYIPETIISANYRNFKEKMNAYLDWMRSHSEEFNFESSITMLDSANKVLDDTDYCFMRNFEPDEDTGYIWSCHPVLKRLKGKIVEEYSGHSGSSLAWTLRLIQLLLLI